MSAARPPQYALGALRSVGVRLGKSSLLQAGAFPLLREADYLPLYLRLDHGIEVARAFRPVMAWLGGRRAAETSHGLESPCHDGGRRPDSWAGKPMPVRP